MAKPILFNTGMVRAILEGRKTVTRRVVKPHHLRLLDGPFHKENPETPDKTLLEMLCIPPYGPGDILYVRETWRENDSKLPWEPYGNYIYRADVPLALEKWHPSIHMPKEAARIFLRVTDVRVERLQDIEEDGAIAEGCSTGDVLRRQAARGALKMPPDEWTAREDFSHVWDSTIKPTDRDKYGWEANPWVWVIEFQHREKPEGFLYAVYA